MNTRTSTQARSHAQKFFVKLDKKLLTLEEFLKDLDLKEVEENLLASGMDNTDYDEEREVNIIANRKLRGSVMNIALPGSSEEKKKQEALRNEENKRNMSEIDDSDIGENPRQQLIDNIRNEFEQHANEGNLGNRNRIDKRVKVSENDERGFVQNGDIEEKPCSEKTAVTSSSKRKDEKDEETPMRKLSLSNFEIIPTKDELNSFKDTTPNHGTPQPDRTENMIMNQLVFK